MILSFTIGLIHDASAVLAKEGFASMNKGERIALVEDHFGKHYPELFKDYIASLHGVKGFTEEVNAVASFYKGGAIGDPGNIQLVVADYLARDFGYALDKLGRGFYLLDTSERGEMLRKIFSGKSSFSKMANDYLIDKTYQEINLSVNEGIGLIKKVPVVLVQTACAPTDDLMNEIRDYFYKNFDGAFTEFQVNPALLGGVKVFVDGEVKDFSWVAQSMRLSSYSIN